MASTAEPVLVQDIHAASTPVRVGQVTPIAAEPILGKRDPGLQHCRTHSRQGRSR